MLHSTPPYRGPARLVQGLNSFVFMAMVGALLALGSMAAAQSQGSSPPAEAPTPAASPADADGENPQGRAPTAPPESADAAEEPAPDEDSPPSVTQSMESFVKSLQISALWRGNDLRQWGILLGAIFLGLLLGKFVSFSLGKTSDKLTRRKFLAELLQAAAGPANLLLITMGISVGLMQLRMSTGLRAFAGDVVKLLTSLAVFWFLYNLISVVELLLRRMTSRTHSTLDDQVVPLIRKALRIFLVIVAALFIAENVFGANIGAWLAGLGIAGLAVSLAAQDSIKNFFGSITILFDRPFKVGDFISFGGKTGTVVEIGFRSTRVRLLTGAILTIPNNQVINETVENISARPWIRRDVRLRLPLETPPAKAHEAVSLLREILAQDGLREGVTNAADPSIDPPRVYFADVAADHLSLLVIYWYRPAAYWDYMDHAERFNYEVFRRFGEAGIVFAFPTQIVRLAGESEAS